MPTDVPALIERLRAHCYCGSSKWLTEDRPESDLCDVCLAATSLAEQAEEIERLRVAEGEAMLVVEQQGQGIAKVRNDAVRAFVEGLKPTLARAMPYKGPDSTELDDAFAEGIAHAIEVMDAALLDCLPEAERLPNSKQPDVRAWIEGLSDEEISDAYWRAFEPVPHGEELKPWRVRAALLALCGGSEHEGSGSGAMTRPDAREVGPPDAPPATFEVCSGCGGRLPEIGERIADASWRRWHVECAPATPGEPQEEGCFLEERELRDPQQEEPTLRSLIGSVPNLTGGVPAEEWVRAKRDAPRPQETRTVFTCAKCGMVGPGYTARDGSAILCWRCFDKDTSRAPTEAAVEAALREIDDLAQCIRLTENDEDRDRALLNAQCHALAIQDHLDDLGIKGSLRLAAARAAQEER